MDSYAGGVLHKNDKNDAIFILKMLVIAQKWLVFARKLLVFAQIMLAFSQKNAQNDHIFRLYCHLCHPSATSSATT